MLNGAKRGDGAEPLVGIGITTFNRRDMLARAVDAVKRHTRARHILFVADDGSEDGSSEFLAGQEIPYLSASNRGIAWNKNRALFYLHNICRCDVVILLEDDTYPNADGWEDAWVKGASRYGHLNLAPAHWDVTYLSGDGTLDAPYVSRQQTGQCSSFHRLALDYVGFMDSRFRRYGYEHAEHTYRMVKAGFGGLEDSDGKLLTYLIRGDLVVEGLDKPPDFEGIRLNGPIMVAMERDPLYRAPWRDDGEMALFRSEMEQVVDSGEPEADIHDRAPGWYMRCFSGHLLQYDDTTGSLHASERDGAAPGRHVPVVLRFGRSACYLGVNSRSTALIGWLKIKDDGVVVVVETRDEATEISLRSLPADGFALAKSEQFLCCEGELGPLASFSRQTAGSWETLRFAGYAIEQFAGH